MCEGNCLHCPVFQRGHECTEEGGPERQREFALQEQRERIHQQIREDTCEEHGVFCCDECFDMSVAFTIEVPVSPEMLERLRAAQRQIESS
jgi:hypothetical protein